MPDLDAYFARLGIARPAAADLAALRCIVFAHATRIPFETLDAWRGRAVDLRPEAVERKLVHDRRGGWCFEQNGLLGSVLRALGFDVIDYAARVLLGHDIDAVRPRTHRLLGVRLPEGLQFVDVGFGGLTLTGVLAHRLDVEQATPHETCRLVERDGDLFLQVRVGGEWTTLYRFALEPQQAVDFEAANFQLVHDPASYFRHALICALATAEARFTLHDREFTIHHRDGRTDERQLTGSAEVLDVLATRFGIAIDRVDGVRERAAVFD